MANNKQNKKKHYRIRNWSHYNHALKQRGSLSVWIADDLQQTWFYDGPPTWGSDPTYADLAIETCLKLRLLFSLPLRQTQGFVASIFHMLELDLPVPDYSTLSRRAKDLEVSLMANKNKPDTDAAHIVIDSTGLKVYGEGEWKQRQHGKSKRRTWRKIHIAVDPDTGEITAERLTGNGGHDCSQVEALLEETLEVRESVDTVAGDGAYDTWKSYEVIEAVGAEPVIPPKKNAKIKRHGNCSGEPLPRDEAIRYTRRHGRAKWKREHGYHRRSLAETAIFRLKQVIGGVLRSREESRQQTEARLGCQLLNQMLGLGMPDSYAVAVN